MNLTKEEINSHRNGLTSIGRLCDMAEAYRQACEQKHVATVTVGPHDHGPFEFDETGYGADTLPNGLTKLYAAPVPAKPFGGLCPDCPMHKPEDEK